MTDAEMSSVTGEAGPLASVVSFLLGAFVSQVFEEVLDYYGFSEWMQETAIPAVENAVKESMETLGETCLEYPMACTPIY